MRGIPLKHANALGPPRTDVHIYVEKRSDWRATLAMVREVDMALQSHGLQVSFLLKCVLPWLL